MNCFAFLDNQTNLSISINYHASIIEIELIKLAIFFEDFIIFKFASIDSVIFI